MVHVRFRKPVPVNEIRDALEQRASSANRRSRTSAPAAPSSSSACRSRPAKPRASATRSRRRSTQKFGKDTFEVLRVELVGPRVGQDLRQRAMLAVLFATLLMGAYIWFRFELRFGIGAAVALVHDVLIVVGALSLCELRDRPDRGRGAADGRRLLGARHGHRVRPHPREHAQEPARAHGDRSSTAASTRR